MFTVISREATDAYGNTFTASKVVDIHDAVGVHGNACICGQTINGVPCTSTFTDRSTLRF